MCGEEHREGGERNTYPPVAALVLSEATVL